MVGRGVGEAKNHDVLGFHAVGDHPVDTAQDDRRVVGYDEVVRQVELVRCVDFDAAHGDRSDFLDGFDSAAHGTYGAFVFPGVFRCDERVPAGVEQVDGPVVAVAMLLALLRGIQAKRPEQSQYVVRHAVRRGIEPRVSPSCPNVTVTVEQSVQKGLALFDAGGFVFLGDEFFVGLDVEPEVTDDALQAAVMGGVVRMRESPLFCRGGFARFVHHSVAIACGGQSGLLGHGTLGFGVPDAVSGKMSVGNQRTEEIRVKRQVFFTERILHGLCDRKIAVVFVVIVKPLVGRDDLAAFRSMLRVLGNDSPEVFGSGLGLGTVAEGNPVAGFDALLMDSEHLMGQSVRADYEVAGFEFAHGRPAGRGRDFRGIGLLLTSSGTALNQNERFLARDGPGLFRRIRELRLALGRDRVRRTDRVQVRLIPVQVLHRIGQKQVQVLPANLAGVVRMEVLHDFLVDAAVQVQGRGILVDVPDYADYQTELAGGQGLSRLEIRDVLEECLQVCVQGCLPFLGAFYNVVVQAVSLDKRVQRVEVDDEAVRGHGTGVLLELRHGVRREETGVRVHGPVRAKLPDVLYHDVLRRRRVGDEVHEHLVAGNEALGLAPAGCGVFCFLEDRAVGTHLEIEFLRHRCLVRSEFGQERAGRPFDSLHLGPCVVRERIQGNHGGRRQPAGHLRLAGVRVVDGHRDADGENRGVYRVVQQSALLSVSGQGGAEEFRGKDFDLRKGLYGCDVAVHVAGHGAGFKIDRHFLKSASVLCRDFAFA